MSCITCLAINPANFILTSRVWDTATGQCLRTLVHEDNAPVTTVRFSPNGRYILAFTLDSCIRLWDYVSGTCKKTYQGHVNNKYSLGGAFGVGGTEGFIVSGSEDGNLVFWDVRTKDMVQKVSGHEGVVLWVDTSPGVGGKVVSGGLDGTVRIWVDVNEDEEDLEGANGVKRNPQILMLQKMSKWTTPKLRLVMNMIPKGSRLCMPMMVMSEYWMQVQNRWMRTNLVMRGSDEHSSWHCIFIISPSQALKCCRDVATSFL